MAITDGAADRLLALALARPREALAEADRLLAADPGPYAASLARQVRAIVWRDEGRVREALAELRHATRLAQRSADPERLAEVRATHGLTLGLAGRAAEGLRTIDRAVTGTTGVMRGRALLRRAVLMRVLGRHQAALADLRVAIRALHRGGDRIWEARAHTHRFLVFAALGQAARGDRDLVVAERRAGPGIGDGRAQPRRPGLSGR